MIIGLTVHDNDFQDILYRFAKHLANGQFILEQPPESIKDIENMPSSQTSWYNWHRTTDEICKAALKSINPTEDQKRIVIETIKRSWQYFIREHKAETYLTDSIRITIPEHINSKWQNGEQFYVFPTSCQEQILCF